MRHIFSALLGAFLLVSPLTRAEDAPHPGPRSPEEETLLFQTATESLKSGSFKSAIHDFERLIERYPSTPHLHEAYFSLFSALLSGDQSIDIEKYARELLALKPDAKEERKAKVYLAHSLMSKKQYFDAKTLAEEILKDEPSPFEKALSLAVQFRGLLEEKEYPEAQDSLNQLESYLESNDFPDLKKKIPEYKMLSAIRNCAVSHLLKHKEFTEEEIKDYFSEKNICFKEARVYAPKVDSTKVIEEWCTSFNSLWIEVNDIHMDKFLREKLIKEISSTRENTNCHEPKKAPQKHHRKSRVRKQGSR